MVAGTNIVRLPNFLLLYDQNLLPSILHPWKATHPICPYQPRLPLPHSRTRCPELPVSGFGHFGVHESSRRRPMEQPELRRRIPPDFIAQVRYLSTEEGGRRTPARSGYRPHFKLPYKEWLTSCNQEFLDKEIVNPGDTVFAEMKILWIEAFEHCLAPGDSFSLG